MGIRVIAFISFLVRSTSSSRRHSPVTSPDTGLVDLPENCVAAVLLHLEPPQICRLAILNTVFRDASSADFIWESKLPLNHGDIIDRVFKDEANLILKNSCKRDIYSMLCRPNFIDNGIKKVWLDKRTAKSCMLVSSKGLSITGIDDRRYWTRISTEQSIFSSVAYLKQIWWFEIDGEIDFPFPSGSYSLYFRLQLGKPQKRFGRRVCNSEHVHGWDRKPVVFRVSCVTDGVETSTKQCHLEEKAGKWMNYHAGDFKVGNCSKSIKVKFSMTQTDCTHTKGGLCVDSVVIYPVEYKDKGSLL